MRFPSKCGSVPLGATRSSVLLKGAGSGEVADADGADGADGADDGDAPSVGLP